MKAALLAMHYQNDVLHPDGKIRVGLDADNGARQRLLDSAAALLDGARARSLPIVHVRIAFRPDYADLLPNCAIFRNVASIGAVPEGQWGSEFYDGLQPVAASPREFVVKHTADWVPIAAGERIMYDYGGGGGWGDPLDRDPQAVLDDVLDEFVSVEGAERDYGVVFTGSLADLTIAVDGRGTEALRTKRRAA